MNKSEKLEHIQNILFFNFTYEDCFKEYSKALCKLTDSVDYINLYNSIKDRTKMTKSQMIRWNVLWVNFFSKLTDNDIRKINSYVNVTGLDMDIANFKNSLRILQHE